MGRDRARQGAVRPGLHVPSSDDRLIANLAALQFGRVSRAQLLGAGLTLDAIKHRVRCGRLIPERPGVFAVAYRANGSNERWATALLDVGDGAFLSHLAAAAKWRMRLPAPLVVDVTSPRRLRSRDGSRLHHRRIDPAEICVVEGIPLTSPSQTLFDLGRAGGSAPSSR